MSESRPRAATSRRLADATWPEVGHARHDAVTVMVPVGATEQHGPHLPLDTDTTIASAVAEGLAARLPRVWVAPAVGYGASGEHQHFAGTCSIGHDALRLVLIELVRSLSAWADRVVLVNGHGGNAPTVAAVVTQLSGEGHRVAWAPCHVRDADAHAGRTETSLMLHLRPDAVRVDQVAPGNTAPLREILGAMQAGGVVAVSPTGVLGDPRGASAAEGERLLDDMVEAAWARIAPA